MRQPTAAAVDQPNIPVALRVILNAIPNDRLAGLLYELARVAGVIDVPEPAPSPQSAAGKRPPGRPKGKPRGKHKSAVAAKTEEAGPDTKFAAQRRRDAQRKREKRAAAKKHAPLHGKVANSTNGAHHTTGTTATPSPAPADDRAMSKRERHAGDMRARRARKAAARQADGSDKAADAAAKVLWECAALRSPKEPWKEVARAFGTNMALAVDSWRSKSLPPGVEPEAVHRFIEASPN
jgi:hypothetical protein